MSNEQEQPRESVGAELGDLPAREVPADPKGGATSYIGETEKNLDAVFPRAPRSDVTLLYTDGDSLFKR